MTTRRQLLRAVGVGSVAGLAGCSAVGLSRPTMNLAVANYRPTSIDVEITVVRPGSLLTGDERVYHERAEIPVMSGESDIWRREDFLEAREYRIETVVRDTGTRYQYRYEPTCSAGEVEDVGVRIDLEEDADVRFSQSRCSGGGLSL